MRPIKERNPAGAFFAELSAGALLLYGSYGGWQGGRGLRFLVPVVPLLILASAFWTLRAFAGARRGCDLNGDPDGPRALGQLDPAQGGFAAGLGELGATDFRLLASRLVTGWAFLWMAPLASPRPAAGCERCCANRERGAAPHATLDGQRYRCMAHDAERARKCCTASGIIAPVDGGPASARRVPTGSYPARASRRTFIGPPLSAVLVANYRACLGA